MSSFTRTTILAAAILGTACSPDNYDSLRKKADVESAEAAENDVKYQNQATEERANAMEEDLVRRHRFFQAVKGTYQGAYQLDDSLFAISVSFSPTLYPYSSTRVRLPEEISYDLTNLAFNVQVRQWKENVDRGASGCRFEEVRPDLTSGQIQVISKECNNAFFISVAEITEKSVRAEDAFLALLAGAGTVLTKAVLNGEATSVPAVVGVIRPTLSSRDVYFKAERIAE